MNSNKEILASALPNLTYLFVILGIIVLFKPSVPILLLIISIFIISKAIYKKETLRSAALSIFWVLVLFACVKILYYYFGTTGVLSLLLIPLFIGLFIVFKNWELYVNILRGIEKKHFGETAEERKARKKKK